MFIVARKTDVRIRKTVDNTIQSDITDAILKGFSLDFIEVEDFDQRLIADYNIIYYIFDGKMHLIINDKKSYTLLKGDAVFVEKGMTYTIRGSFKATTVNKTAYID